MIFVCCECFITALDTDTNKYTKYIYKCITWLYTEEMNTIKWYLKYS